MNAPANELTLGQVQLLLNDHIGERVAVELNRSSVPAALPLLKMVGNLLAWGTELEPSDDPAERDELSVVYFLDGPDHILDLTQLRTVPVPIFGTDEWGLLIPLEGGVGLSISWRDLPDGDE